jgi:hypothetical protein
LISERKRSIQSEEGMGKWNSIPTRSAPARKKDVCEAKSSKCEMLELINAEVTALSGLVPFVI